MSLFLMNIIHTAGNVPESSQSQSKHGIVHRANMSQEYFYILKYILKENECIKYSSSKTKDTHAHKLKFSKVHFDGHSA